MKTTLILFAIFFYTSVYYGSNHIDIMDSKNEYSGVNASRGIRKYSTTDSPLTKIKVSANSRSTLLEHRGTRPLVKIKKMKAIDTVQIRGSRKFTTNKIDYFIVQGSNPLTHIYRATNVDQTKSRHLVEYSYLSLNKIRALIFKSPTKTLHRHN